MLKIFIARRGWSIAACMALLLGTIVLLQALPAYRLDLTDEKLYTLSQGSRGLVSAIASPISLKFYFSRSLAAELPQINDYARRIRDLLEEYQSLNPQQLTLQVIDPSPFSEAEDAAVAAGLQGAPVSLGGDTLYLGLVASNGAGSAQVIRFFNPERERFLEYDISQLLYRLEHPNQPVLGVLDNLQMLGGYDPGSGQMRGPWTVMEQLRGSVEVRELQAPLATIAAEIQLLMITQPQQLDEKTLYAIDQFALGGGSALVFIDPLAEVAGATATAPEQEQEPAIERLFRRWGVAYDSNVVLADRQRGLRVATSSSAPALPHVGVIGLTAAEMNRDDIITAELETLNLASAGVLTAGAKATTRFTPLLSSSRDAMLINREAYLASTDQSELLTNFVAVDKPFTIAARLRGRAQSAFTRAPPAAVDDQSDDQAGLRPPAAMPAVTAASQQPHRSAGDINLILVADVDLLSDRLWVQVSNFFGQQVVVPWASNGDFVINAVENLSASEALISLRSRGQYTRPFTRINQLRTSAAAEFKQQEQALLQRLNNLEARIASLSADTNEQDQLVLSAAQRAEIEAFERQRLETRKQLRQVQRQLNRSIDELEMRLRWLNMGLLPALLLLILFAVVWWRRHRAGW